MSGEAMLAWRLFIWNWALVGAMALSLALALALTEFSLQVGSTLLSLSAIAVYGGAAAYNAWAPRRREPWVVFTLGTTAQLIAIGFLMTPLTYVAASLAMPLKDATFAAIDRALGIDWMVYFEFFYERPALLPVLSFGYAMIGWPVFGVPVALGFTGHFARLQQFTLAFALALIFTTAVSAVLPALGTIGELGVKADPEVFTSAAYASSSHDMPLIRSGALRELDITQLVGIVTFPSFHACAAVLYLWAFWPVRWMRPVAVASNGLMLVATPVGGAHYFIDIFAGIAVAVLAIAFARALSRRLTASPGRECSLCGLRIGPAVG